MTDFLAHARELDAADALGRLPVSTRERLHRGTLPVLGAYAIEVSDAWLAPLGFALASPACARWRSRVRTWSFRGGTQG